MGRPRIEVKNKRHPIALTLSAQSIVMMVESSRWRKLSASRFVEDLVREKYLLDRSLWGGPTPPSGDVIMDKITSDPAYVRLD
jgi:hypothetical protein